MTIAAGYRRTVDYRTVDYRTVDYRTVDYVGDHCHEDHYDTKELFSYDCVDD